MAPNLLLRLVRACGFCCPYAFFRAVRGRSHGQVADRLGVHKQSIAYWRRKIKKGECQCERRNECALVRFKNEIPRVSLVGLREGTKDGFVEWTIPPE